MHIPVLPTEVIDGLDVKPTDIVVDATVNGAGHAHKIGERLGSEGLLVGLDADGVAVSRAKDALTDLSCRVTVVQANFRDLEQELDKLGIGAVNKVLFDFGLSSNQLDNPERGFSFKEDGPLLMTLKDSPTENDLTAATFLNGSSEAALADIIFAYGGERYARRIARAIVDARSHGPFMRTSELVEVIVKAVPESYRRGRIHPATRTFQALRMAVNDELGSIRQGLAAAFKKLTPGGRIAAISFHSLEDRIVKNFFRNEASLGHLKIITKKPIVPSRNEVIKNKRSRSAKLRAGIKI